MADHEPKGGERSYEQTIEINAPVDAVWKAITDAAELMRWFPLQAEVKPGLGGSVFLAWGTDFSGTAPITAWEPNNHFQWTETLKPGGDAGSEPVPVAIDFFLEGSGGRTRLRLVHSGIGRGKTWDGYLDSITRGWKFELRGLRHYLHHHRGRDRVVLWARRTITMDPAAFTRKAIGGAGCVLKGAIEKLKEGERYRLEDQSASGRHLEGVVAVNGLPRSFAATVENLNQAYFRWEVEGIGDENEAWLWLSTYGLDAATRAAMESDWKTALAAAGGS